MKDEDDDGESSAKDAKTSREEWMMVPPESRVFGSKSPLSLSLSLLTLESESPSNLPVTHIPSGFCLSKKKR